MKKTLPILSVLLLCVTGYVAWQWVAHNLTNPSGVSAAYTVSNSARFNDDDSAYLSKTPAGAGNRKTWTFSAWVRRGNLGIDTSIFGARGSDSTQANSTTLEFDTSDRLEFGYGDALWRVTTQVFRDPAAWQHIVAVLDTTQATANDRVKLYVNGVQVTAFSTTNNPAQNDEPGANAAIAHRIGSYAAVAPQYLDGYLSDVYFIDGTATTSGAFGEYDSNGYWRPKSYSGSYGTNGFKLDFANSGDLGNDVSGNANDWTSNNLDTTDQVVDTPTNAYATLNHLDLSGTTGVYSNGNLGYTYSVGAWAQAYSSIQVTSGKWYAELTIGSDPTDIYPGLITGTTNPAADRYFGQDSYTYGYAQSDGRKINNATFSAYGTSFTTNDVVGVILDADNGKLYFSKNCTVQNSGDPVAGTGAAFTGLSGPYRFGVGAEAGGIGSINFGQGGTTTLTYDSSAGGYFYCTPPTGFKALSTYNLPEPAVVVPKNYFDARTYIGTGAAQSVVAPAASSAGTTVRVFLTTTATSTWVVPSDWNPGNNSIEVIGGGGGGPAANAGCSAGTNCSIGTGGGGGAYSKISNLAVAPGTSLTAIVGTAGAAATAVTNTNTLGTAGGDTFVCVATSTASACNSISGVAVVVGAKGGAAGSAGQTSVSGVSGGASSSGVGSTKYSGGNSGSGTGACSTAATGGGGAGGPSGAGGTSSDADSCGTGADGTAGGAGGAGSGGAGGAAAGGAGSNGTEWTTHGSGGGGGGAPSGSGGGGAGGNYGAGGGGGSSNHATNPGGAGKQGIVVITYVSTGASSGFTPDLAWIKNRTDAASHALFDAVRGVQKFLSSDSTAAEDTDDTQSLSSFDSRGFTLGTGASTANVNTNGKDYVSWLWKESPTAGFDIVTYTGNGSARTISHSLGKSADFIIVKNRTAASTDDWAVHHSSNTSAPETDYLLLNSAALTADDATYWNDTKPTASVFSIGTNADVNTSGNEYVAYAFASTTGFSAFGSYTGNGSADGPFVYTGFRPKYVMLKRTSGAGTVSWRVYDTSRQTYNENKIPLLANGTSGDGTPETQGIDFLSNGFKIRWSDDAINGSGSEHVYAAFADIPFKYSAASAAAAAGASASHFLFGIDF